MFVKEKKKIVLLGVLVFLLASTFLLEKIVKERVVTRQKAAGNIPACQGEISVANSSDPVEFRSPNTFTVTVRNTGTSTLTTTVVDEVWHDRNCDGIEDRLQCDVVGLKGPDCGWGVTNVGIKEWKDVSLAVGETKQLEWSLSGYVPDFCFVHTLYFWSTPISGANACYKGRTYGYEEAQSGNLMFKNNQAKFSTSNNMPLLSGTSFGVVDHNPWGDATRMATLERDINSLAADSSKMRVFRLGVNPKPLIKSVNTAAIEWNEEQLQKVDGLINLLNAKGFKVVLVIGPYDNPCGWNSSCAPIFEETAYHQYITRYYDYLSKRWKGKIYIWNVFNEVDMGCFSSTFGQCNKPIPDTAPTYTSSGEYVTALNKVLGVIRPIIKKNDPPGFVTVSLTSWIEHWYYRELQLADGIINNMDGLAFSLYPGKESSLLRKMPGLVDFFRARYNKPIFVFETGLKEWDNTKTEDAYNKNCIGNAVENGERANLLTSYFSTLNKHANMALLYEFQDVPSINWANNDPKECFLTGIVRPDGSKKPSYSALVNYVDANGILPSVLPISVASTPTPTVPTVTPTPQITGYINQIISTGQSLSQGYLSSPALSTSQPYNNKMFCNNVLVPLIEGRGSSCNDSRNFETMSSSMGNTITRLTGGNNYLVSVNRFGVGAIGYSGLKKGTVPYNNSITSVRTIYNSVNRQSKVIGVTAINGETDHLTGSGMAFKNSLSEWQRDYETDIKAVTGQTGTIPLFTDQMSSFTAYGSTTSLIPAAQLAAAEESLGKIVLVGPKYFLDYIDGIHLTNTSERKLGEYYGKVIKKVVVDGQVWRPLSPRAITRNENIIYAQFYVPVLPISFDTTLVTAKLNKGFEYYDDQNSASITNVEIYSPDTVKITLNRVPTGGNQKLKYAYTGTAWSPAGARLALETTPAPSVSPSNFDSARGNLRDSDTTSSAYGNNLYNWAVQFDKPVVLGMAPTLAPTSAPVSNQCLPPNLTDLNRDKIIDITDFGICVGSKTK